MMIEGLERALQQHFNYDQFRPGQKEIVEYVLQGEDVLGVLPTGSGKSICYQLPSLLLPHITVVVSPLISLMIDQVRETKAFHIKEVVALHSMVSFAERKDILQKLDAYKIVYISPELIQNEYVISALKKRKISLFVIDEAHCISQWGYDFRPDYLRLQEVIKTLGDPAVLALSATITNRIEEDIKQELQRPDLKVLRQATDRENITLLIEEIGNNESKDERLVHLLERYKVPTIIYFSSRKQAEELAHTLSVKLGKRRVAYYHGGLDQLSRLKIQQQFLYDQLSIICATSAFGMGINKPNVRLIIHYHLPAQKEAFIQEIGRAGRDGKQSVSLLLYKPGDEFIPQQLIENELPTELEVRRYFNYLYLLFQKKQSLPTSQTDLETVLNINETKIKFLHYQVESRHMIKYNEIVYDFTRWKNALDDILDYCERRKQIKLINFERMLHYVYTKDCLRVELYKEFETNIRKQKNCCSRCRYDKDLLTDEVLTKEEAESLSWQEELRQVLGLDEVNEST